MSRSGGTFLGHSSPEDALRRMHGLLEEFGVTTLDDSDLESAMLDESSTDVYPEDDDAASRQASLRALESQLRFRVPPSSLLAAGATAQQQQQQQQQQQPPLVAGAAPAGRVHVGGALPAAVAMSGPAAGFVASTSYTAPFVGGGGPARLPSTPRGSPRPRASRLRADSPSDGESPHRGRRHVDGTMGEAMAAGVFRLQMSDLDISHATYTEIRAKPEDELTVKEWVQLRMHEARTIQKAECERLRSEMESLRDNLYTAQVSKDACQRQLDRRDATVDHLKEELSLLQTSSRTQLEKASQALKASEARVAELIDQGRRFDEVNSQKIMFEEELERLRDAFSAQSAEQQRLGKERLRQTEQLHELETELRLAKADSESLSKRARLLEDGLSSREREATELRAKVESLKEKKKELARKAISEQAATSQELREQVNAEIKRLQDQSQHELETVRTNLNHLHERELQSLQSNLDASESRCSELQKRLEEEEQSKQLLQLTAARTKSELQNELTELTGALKLKQFELERAALTHQEVSQERQRLATERVELEQKLEVAKKEYYNLELESREGRAVEKAELATLREQLRAYSEVERELDAAVRSVADSPPEVSNVEGRSDALILGTTLASAPSSAQRRIQQSLILAQEVQRHAREAARARAAENLAQDEIVKLKEELQNARSEVRYSSEPQSYLIDLLREKDGEISALKKEQRNFERDLEKARRHAERSDSLRMEAEEDMRRLLAHREHVAFLQGRLPQDEHAHLGRTAQALSQPSRAEQRGRKPTQTMHGGQYQLKTRGLSEALKTGPAWYQRLKSKAATPSALEFQDPNPDRPSHSQAQSQVRVGNRTSNSQTSDPETSRNRDSVALPREPVASVVDPPTGRSGWREVEFESPDLPREVVIAPATEAAAWHEGGEEGVAT